MLGFIVISALLVGWFFGRMEATACRQRAAFADAEVKRHATEVERLTCELEEARKRPTTVGFDDNLGGVAR